MRRVTIDEAQPDQVVSRPVTSAAGVVFVQPGTVLTTELIGRLRNLAVDALWVEGQDPNARPARELLEELDRRFAGHEQDRLMMELKAIVAAGFERTGVDGQDG